MIVDRGDCQDAFQLQGVPCESQYCVSRFECISTSPEGFEKCKSDVDVIEPIAFNQSAQTDRGVGRTKFRQIQSEPQATIHVLGTTGDVRRSFVSRVHIFVADVAQPRWVVEQRENEWCVFCCEVTQSQALGFGNGRIVNDVGQRCHCDVARAMFCFMHDTTSLREFEQTCTHARSLAFVLVFKEHIGIAPLLRANLLEPGP